MWEEKIQVSLGVQKGKKCNIIGSGHYDKLSWNPLNCILGLGTLSKFQEKKEEGRWKLYRSCLQCLGLETTGAIFSSKQGAVGLGYCCIQAKGRLTFFAWVSVKCEVALRNSCSPEKWSLLQRWWGITCNGHALQPLQYRFCGMCLWFSFQTFGTCQAVWLGMELNAISSTQTIYFVLN